MKRSKLKRRLMRPFRDFMLGLGLFAAVAAPGVAGHLCPSGPFGGEVHAGLFRAGHAEGLPLSDPSQHLMLLIILGIVSASLFALNMWFIRHLRRAYRRPRRR